MKHGSLFSGIGGFDLAAQWMGWENVFHCEKEPFCQKVLKYYWPDAELFTDITKSDFTKYANTIDILTGGFPCQPYSTAGKRKGKEDERHLWPEMLRAIREIQPRWIVGENVRGLTNWNGGMVFDEVQADLEAEGYEILPFLLPACAVNAPHRRDRIWFVAHANSNGFCRNNSVEKNNNRRIQERVEERYEFDSLLSNGNATNTKKQRLEKRNGKQAQFRTHTTTERHNCISQWQDFPTQPPIWTRNDGVSIGLDVETISEASWRTESIKGSGNAIVPGLAYEIFKAIEQLETIKTSK